MVRHHFALVVVDNNAEGIIFDEGGIDLDTACSFLVLMVGVQQVKLHNNLQECPGLGIRNLSFLPYL